MNECEQIRKEYNDIITLKQEFDSALAEAQTEANTSQEAKDALENAKELKTNIENKMRELKEKLRNIKWKQYNPREMESVVKKEEYQVKETLEGHEGWVDTLQVLPDGRIVSGSSDGTIKIWEKDQTGKYQVKETLEGHRSVVVTLQVLPDGRIVSGIFDKTIKIWDGEQV